ncbi:hypothetical protein ACF0H5_012727 [Mactra antiquata]
MFYIFFHISSKAANILALIALSDSFALPVLLLVPVFEEFPLFLPFLRPFLVLFGFAARLAMASARFFSLASLTLIGSLALVRASDVLGASSSFCLLFSDVCFGLSFSVFPLFAWSFLPLRLLVFKVNKRVLDLPFEQERIYPDFNPFFISISTSFTEALPISLLALIYLTISLLEEPDLSFRFSMADVTMSL